MESKNTLIQDVLRFQSACILVTDQEGVVQFGNNASEELLRLSERQFRGMRIAELFIDGESRPASDGALYDVYNPARPKELVGMAAEATTKDIDHAVAAAQKAFPSWSERSHEERGELLRDIAAMLASDTEDIQFRSQLFTREHGKIARETHLEMSRLSDRFMNAAAYADRPWHDRMQKN